MTNIPILWLRYTPISVVDDLYSSFRKIVTKVTGLLVSDTNGSPQSRSNGPSPANSVSLVTPSNCEGDSAKIVSSAGFNTMPTFGDSVSSPSPHSY